MIWMPESAYLPCPNGPGGSAPLLTAVFYLLLLRSVRISRFAAKNAENCVDSQ